MTSMFLGKHDKSKLEKFNFDFRYKPREVSSNGDDLALIRLPTLAVTVEEDLRQSVLPGDNNDMQKIMFYSVRCLIGSLWASI